jgi:chemotaxis protein methyltransferase CheR
MNVAQTISTAQLQQIRNYLAESCGIVIGDAWHHTIESGVARILAAHKVDSVDKFLSLPAAAGGCFRDSLVNAVIPRESSWFRDNELYDAITTELLPLSEHSQSDRGESAFRIWSAGCSTGQEPYSLAIALHNYHELSINDSALPPSYEILGTDVSPAALFIAVSGRYNSRAMTGDLSEDYLVRYFERDRQVYCLRDTVRRAVHFRQHNLLDPATDLADGPIDLVFLRYVLEFYTTATQQTVIGHIAEAMRRGGVLCLGKDEVLPENDWFEPITLAGYHCFRRKQ